ncbi:MAG: MBL fold metallo-hydrolase [Opitutales bacterium]
MRGMEFRMLGSSSSGNSALLKTADSLILIDAGFSARRLGQLMAKAGYRLEELDAICVTHEHADHCKGIGGLAKLAHLPVFANRHTARAIQSRLKHRPNWRLFENGRAFGFRDLTIQPFSVPHDAVDPVAFFFETGNDDLFSPKCSLAWVTDLGHAPTLVRERIRSADCLVLEANHDNDLLDRDERRPWSTKQRIKGRHGHLSNAAAFSLLKECLSEGARPAWRSLVLAHLSKDCNRPRLVEDCFEPLRAATPAGPLALQVIDPTADEPAEALAVGA